jgi:two-component system, NtrC family, sensor histidine kinase KinB
MSKQQQWSGVLYNIAQTLHHLRLDLDKIAQTIVSMTGEAIGVKYGCLMTFLNDYSISNAYILGADEKTKADADLWNLLLTRGLVGFVRHGQRTVVVRNINADPRWPDLPKVPYIPTRGSAIGLPLQHSDYIYGVLMFVHPEIDFFDQDKINLLEEIASMASAAVDNALDLQAARYGNGNGHGNGRYKALFESAVVPIILSDMNGSVLDVNEKAAEFLGRTRADLVRLPITSVYPIEATEFKDRHRKLGRGEEIIFETEIFDAKQNEIPLTVRARQMVLGQNDVIEWVAQDMTAQMELEQLRRDLSAMVYHDLRGPLQAIKGSINKLGQVLANHENPAVWTLLQVGIRSTRQLQRMVDSLVDIQRLEEGKAVLCKKPVELRVLLGDSAQLVQPLAAEMNHRLQFEMEDDMPLAMMDGDMIMRVVINLMENSIKYTPEGGTIKLSAQIKDDKVRISVRDSGPGIPHDMQRQVFDKFSRVKYKDAPKGVGLGLAFCRLAIEAHGGRIWVESEPGDGAEFVFTLPLEKGSEEEALESETDSNASLATA